MRTCHALVLSYPSSPWLWICSFQASLHQLTEQVPDVTSADTETQTLFESLTDSHTQTSWKDLMMKFADQL